MAEPQLFHVQIDVFDDPEANYSGVDDLAAVRRALPLKLGRLYRSVSDAPDYLEARFELVRWRVEKDV